jgi:hypothetical protein
MKLRRSIYLHPGNVADSRGGTVTYATYSGKGTQPRQAGQAAPLAGKMHSNNGQQRGTTAPARATRRPDAAATPALVRSGSQSASVAQFLAPIMQPALASDAAPGHVGDAAAIRQAANAAAHAAADAARRAADNAASIAAARASIAHEAAVAAELARLVAAADAQPEALRRVSEAVLSVTIVYGGDQVCLRMQVRCDDCGAEIAAGMRADHAELCAAAVVPCINAQWGCGRTMARCERGVHLCECPACVVVCPGLASGQPGEGDARVGAVERRLVARTSWLGGGGRSDCCGACRPAIAITQHERSVLDQDSLYGVWISAGAMCA